MLHLLQHHTCGFGLQGRPIMTDAEYDALKKSLAGSSVYTLPREGPVCTLGKPGERGKQQVRLLSSCVPGTAKVGGAGPACTLGRDKARGLVGTVCTVGKPGRHRRKQSRSSTAEQRRCQFRPAAVVALACSSPACLLLLLLRPRACFAALRPLQPCSLHFPCCRARRRQTMLRCCC